MTYQEWIAWFELQFDDGNVSDLCFEATLEMFGAYPELRRIRGHVLGEHRERGMGMHAHWWCVAPTGEIVDPTVSQFSRIVEYVPMDGWKVQAAPHRTPERRRPRA